MNNILETGTVLNKKWVILESIGRGAMGEVYRAHQLNLKRDVAIKVISPDWLQCLGEDGEEVETTFQRFRREVEAMAQIRHPNVLQIFDYDSTSIKKADEEVPIEYIAMEYVPGSTLRSTMSEDGFYPDQEPTRAWLLDYFLPVLDGVQAIHEQGIVHRDVKPENVLLDGDTPKIADFGLARSCRLKSVTQSIDAKGTPPYMSPEHFFDFRKADEKADIYSLGKILFEAIDGKMSPGKIPFQSAKLEKAETPFFKKLDQIIIHATAEDRKERLDSSEKLRNALTEAIGTLEQQKVSEVPAPTRLQWILAHPKWIWTGIAAAILSMLLMTIWHLLGEPGKSTRPMKEQPTITKELVPPTPPVLPETSLSSTALPAKLQRKDGMTLHFIPGGTIDVPENFGQESGTLVKLEPFYMDETQVTNQQYVEFLNQVLSTLSIEKGVVRGDVNIWLLLGEVIEGYEPIVFRDGGFSLKDAALASHPVVRVTGSGAAAYARFYERRLPTEVEWLHAARGESGLPQTPSVDAPGSRGWTDMEKTWMHMEDMHEQMMQQPLSTSQPSSKTRSPVTVFEPNDYGIRGLNRNVSEWGLRALTGPSEERIRQAEYVVLGGLGSDADKEYGLPSPISRYPWEAFEEVGFRCVKSVGNPGK